MFLTTRPVVASSFAAIAAMTISLPGCGNDGSTASTATGSADDSATASETDSAAATDVATAPDASEPDATKPDPGKPDASGPADALSTADAAGPADSASGPGIDAASTWVNPNVAVTAQTAPKGKGLPVFAKVVDSSGAAVTNKALLGKWTVIWFYPAASTLG